MGIGDAFNTVYGGVKDAANDIFGDPGNAEDEKRKKLLAFQSAQASRVANAGDAAFAQDRVQRAQAIDALQRVANGQTSLSAEQLRQGVQQNQAAQQSIAAGAAPQNAVASARTAQIQSARLGAGLSGQQATAGIQEREAGTNALTGALGTFGGQDLQQSLQSRANAINASTSGAQGTPEKGFFDKYGAAIIGGIAAASDPATKTNFGDGTPRANAAIQALQNRARTFDFKSPVLGGKNELGTTTTDLQQAGLGHVVKNAGGIEVVDPGKLGTANTALIAALGQRVAALEAHPALKPSSGTAAAPTAGGSGKPIELVVGAPRPTASPFQLIVGAPRPTVRPGDDAAGLPTGKR